MAPFVSIVVPSFNRERCLQTLFASFIRQTLQDFEVVLVDDGSSDNTENILRGIADPRFRYVRHEKNRGAQAARNTGIKTAKGAWVAFFDSDDVMLENSLELRLQAAQQQNCNVVHSECLVLLPSGETGAFGVPPLSGDVYRALLKGPGPVFPSLMVKKEALLEIGCLDENIKAFQEWDTVIRLAKFYPFGYVPEPTFIYDCRGEDTISKDLLRDALGYEQVLRKHYCTMLKHCGLSCLSNHFHRLAGKYAAAGDVPLARVNHGKYLLLSIPGKAMRKLRAAFGMS